MKIQQFTDALTGKAVLNHYVFDIGQYWVFQSRSVAMARVHKFTRETTLSTEPCLSPATAQKYLKIFLRDVQAVVDGSEAYVLALGLEDPDCIKITWHLEDVYVRDAAYRWGELVHTGRGNGDIEYSAPDHNEVRHLPRISVEDAREILYDIQRHDDPEYGVTWDTIDYAVEQYYYEAQKDA